MAAPEQLIPDWVLAFAEKILSFIGFILAGVSGLLFRKYREHVAMLKRHDELLTQNATELGHHRAFRESATKLATLEVMNAALDELKKEDRRIHRRVSEVRRVQDESGDRLTAIETNIQWIRDTLERMEMGK